MTSWRKFIFIDLKILAKALTNLELGLIIAASILVAIIVILFAAIGVIMYRNKIIKTIF